MFTIVDEFICNGCRFDKIKTHSLKKVQDFKDSINQNNYTQKLETVVIDTEDFIKR
jgi:NADH-quinone oxidoreductase subunit G